MPDYEAANPLKLFCASRNQVQGVANLFRLVLEIGYLLVDHVKSSAFFADHLE